MELDDSLKSSLQLDQWDRYSLSECEAAARELWKVLPPPFRFHKVETYSLGDQKHNVAVFEWTGYPDGHYHGFFSLIPGGEITLGYDREHPFVPDEHQKESWEEETEKTGMFNGTLDVFLGRLMTPLRHVSIEPFLLEVLPLPLARVLSLSHFRGARRVCGEPMKHPFLMRGSFSIFQDWVFAIPPLMNGNMLALLEREHFFAGAI